MTGFKSHYITASGIRIHYLREGRGPTLLLLHGWPEFCRVWRKCIPDLAAEFDVIAPDLRGFGDTEKPPPTGRSGPLPYSCRTRSTGWRPTRWTARSSSAT